MRTLHVGNVAGTATNMKYPDDKILINSGNSFNYLCDYHYFIGGKSKFSSFLSCVKTLYRELQYEKIYSHARHVPFSIDLIVSKAMGKDIIIHYHGTDIRNKKHPFIHRMLTNEFYVSTPDLLKYVPDAVWIPNKISLESHIAKCQKHNPIRVLHAPSNRSIKGTQYILDAVNQIKTIGYNIDFKILEKTPHDKVLSEMSRSDIVIDWINSDYNIYGVVSIEAMSMGKPVICSINHDYYDECPIIKADENNIKDVLLKVINMSNNDLRKIGLDSIEYFNRVHKKEVQ